MVRTDPEGCYRRHELQDRAEQHGIRWPFSPAEAHWHQGRAEAVWGILQMSANKFATLDPECPADEIFSWVAQAHNEMYKTEGSAPDQILFGRALRPLDSELSGTVTQLHAEATAGTPAEVAMRRRCHARQSYAEALASRQARLAQVSKARAFRTWSPGELVCYWAEPLSQRAKQRIKRSKGA